MKVRALAGAGVFALGLVRAASAEAPNVDHQPSPCMVPEKPASLCASITDDGQVAAARIYFRPAGDKFYSFVDMVSAASASAVPCPPCARARSR